MQNELHDWEMRNLIHSAVHSNNPQLRSELASRISWHLLADHPIRQPIRQYLSWVLMCLSDKDQLPHLARGNAIKIETRVAFIRRLVKAMQKMPPGPVLKRLETAAKDLGASFGKVRAAYYSDSFLAWSAFEAAAADFSKQPPLNKWNDALRARAYSSLYEFQRR